MWTVGIQLVRAADSIGANIAEAYGRRTRAHARGLPCAAEAKSRAGEVGRLINGLARSWA